VCVCENTSDNTEYAIYANDNVDRKSVRYSGYNSVILNNITIPQTVVSLGVAVATERTRRAA